MNDIDHIRPLTSMRFFAAIWVVLYHYWSALSAGARPGLIEKGYLGVEMFFVLSGFILCHVYLEAFGEKRFRYKAFLWNRLARVYPLHLATLLGVIAMALAAGVAGVVVDPNLTAWRSLPANVFLVQAWGLSPDAAFNHPSWSISAEWFAYLTFPAFAWLFWRLRERPWIGAALALAFIAVIYPAFQALNGSSLTQATFAWGALRIVPCFALGCAMYGLWRAGVVKSVLIAALGALFLGGGTIVASVFGAPDAVAVAGFGALILCLAGLAQRGSSFGSHPFFVYLGEISYSVYMICIPWKILFVNAAVKLLHLPDKTLPLYVWVVFLVSVVPLAAISYHLIERPARAAMKRWADRRASRHLVALTM